MIFILLTCNRQDITNFITIIIIGLVVFFIIIIIIIVFISFISYYDDCDLYICNLHGIFCLGRL